MTDRTEHKPHSRVWHSPHGTTWEAETYEEALEAERDSLVEQLTTYRSALEQIDRYGDNYTPFHAIAREALGG